MDIAQSVFVNWPYRTKEELLLLHLTIYFTPILIFLLHRLFIYQMFLTIQTHIIICPIGAAYLLILCLLLLTIICISLFHCHRFIRYRIPLHLYLPIFLLSDWVHYHQSLLVLLSLISIFLITIRNPHIKILLRIVKLIPRPSRLVPHISIIKMIIICIGFLLLLFLHQLPLFILFQRLYLL